MIPDKILLFLVGQFFLIFAVCLGAYIRLYLLAKMKIKTIVILSIISFVVVEIFFIYRVFFLMKW